jgi:very-short-patch-repair endonuclease
VAKRRVATPPQARHKDELADMLGNALKERLGYAPTKEFRFHPIRRWRFDLLFEPVKLAVEIDGAFHVSQKRLREDAEKRNAAREAGYTVLNYRRRRF